MGEIQATKALPVRQCGLESIQAKFKCSRMGPQGTDHCSCNKQQSRQPGETRIKNLAKPLPKLISNEIENERKKTLKITVSKTKMWLLRLLVKQKVKHELLLQVLTGRAITDKTLHRLSFPLIWCLLSLSC